MASYIIRRLLLVIPTVFLALSFLFLLFFVLPGDPETLIVGGAARTPDPDVVARAQERYGFDDPLVVQFVNYWENFLRWDLGESYVNGVSVNDTLAQAAPRSIRLAIWAMIIEIVVGIAVGLVSAIRRYSFWDTLTTVATAGAAAIPAFALGLALQYFFAVLPGPNHWDLPQWMQLKTSGIGPPGHPDGTWTFFFIPTGEQWRYLVLPAITLACVSTALLTRMVRGSMLDVMRADYMRTARAKGLTERQVIMRHGLRNAMLPAVTLIGVDFGTAIGVAVLTETTFSWPGLGYQISQSLVARDLPVLLGLTFAVVLAYAFINIVVDVSYAWFDPRIRLGQEESS
jgi:ABC-type dipeptide/oligopeptide/nickel transport system permease component